MNSDNVKNNGSAGKLRFAGCVLVPLLLLTVWQIAAMRLDKPWLFPTATQVLAQLLHPLRDHYASGSLLSNTYVSLCRVTIGFVISAVAGVAMGVVMGSVKWIRALIEPTLEVVRPLSAIAWLPFAIAVFKLNTLGHLFGLDYIFHRQASQPLCGILAQ